MDAPTGYVCRITRSDTLQMPTNVKYFEQSYQMYSFNLKS